MHLSVVSRVAIFVFALAAALGACSDDSAAEPTPTVATTTAAPNTTAGPTPTTVVETTPTTALPPTTTTTAPSTGRVEEQVVGDDQIVLAMTQSFPLRQYPGFPYTRGPDQASGLTAGIHTGGDLEGPEDAAELSEFSVNFMAFETEELAAAYLEARHEFLRVVEVQALTGLGDEASVMFVEGDWSYITEHGHALVRHGRFVAETVVVLDEDIDLGSGPEAHIAEAAEVAELTAEVMQTVLSADIQPLPAPQPEALTTYEMNVRVHRDPFPPEVFSIVTPEGYGCMILQFENDETQPGVAEIGDDAFEQIDWNEGWFASTTDSPAFQSLKDACHTWSPQLEESYLGDLIRSKDGQVGISKGRPTLSYWFTKDDFIGAGVLRASDNITIDSSTMIVDQAGPWLVSFRISFEGDAEAIRRLVRLDIPGLGTASSLVIDIGYGIIDDGTETWADRLEAWIQPRL